MNEALNEAVHERFRFIEGRLYWLQFIRFFRGPFNVQMLHIPALQTPPFTSLVARHEVSQGTEEPPPQLPTRGTFGPP